MVDNPKLRKEAEIELRSLVMNGVLKILESKFHYPYRTCLNCFHFIEKDENCKMYNARPPARIIAYGCKSHDDNDNIPF